VYFVSEAAQVELKSGRVEAPAVNTSTRSRSAASAALLSMVKRRKLNLKQKMKAEHRIFV
jgi:hypothetical protein